MRADDIYELRSVGQVALHPDGRQVVFTITWPDLASDENRAQLFIHDGTDHRQLTESHRDVSPVFSPDGERLAFLRSEAKGKAQPAVLTLRTGAVQILAGYEDDGAEQVLWLSDDALLVRAPRRPAGQIDIDDDELARRPRILRTVDYRFNGRGYTHDRKRQIEILDLASGVVTTLGKPDVDHSDMAVAPEGTAVLAIATTDVDADLSGGNRVWLIAADKSESTLLTPEPGRWEGVGFMADGNPFAIGMPTPSGVSLARPHILDIDGESSPALIGNHDVTCAAPISGGSTPVALSDALLATGIHRTGITIDRYDLMSNELTSIAAGPFVVRDFSASSDGRRIVASVSTPIRPAELWEFDDDGHRVIVPLNDPFLSELDLVDPEVVQVPSTGGAVVEAFVVRPPRSATTDGGAPGPGLVYVHGGPMSIYGHGFFDEFQLAAADGYTVVAGNPRGSDGYGEAWARAIVGQLGGPDWDDVQALTDVLAALPEVDSERIGIGGGSYGGFMAAWAIGHTDRYGAALVERAVTNWESFAGTSDIGSYFLPMLLDATVEDDVESLRRQSPLSYATDVETPTLILHSEEDWRCPIEQAEQLFAAYRRCGVDVTFVRFPGENHELSRNGSPVHRVERFRLVHGFFAEHLKSGSSTV